MATDNYILETERIGLRAFREDDVDAVARVFADPYAQRSYPQLSEPPKAAQWIEQNLERYAADGFGLWAACLKKTGELIGDCGLARQMVETRVEVEVGYHLRADVRGRGLATEGARVCLDHGFGELQAERLVSMVHPANHASKRLAASTPIGRAGVPRLGTARMA